VSNIYKETEVNQENTVNASILQHKVDKHETKLVKIETLKKLTVTLSDGKVFYADAESRIDLRDAIELGIELNKTSTAWKLAEDFNGSRIVEVTIDELKEASKLALMTKGNIVGAI